MVNLTKCLTSIFPELRSGPSPGRRLLAAVLCAMLVLGSVSPGIALAGEADSEGEGTAPTVEVPIAPDFDPGGEEGGLEEVPAVGGDEESGAVEAEPEVDVEAPAAEEVTSAAAEAPVEAQSPTPATAPEPMTSAPEPIQQQAPEPVASEPVANQSIVAPQQKPTEQRADSSGASDGEAPPLSEAPTEEAPSAPLSQPAATPPADHGRHLGGKDSYVVRSGDCLWHIAAALLPASASDAEIAGEVARLWALNEDSIGTGDPSLIYAGTTLRLR
jgi:outer membrane biosynthesis protein TonB